jgi:hypothetical protein
LKDSDKQLQFPHGELETKPANEVWMHSETKRLACLSSVYPDQEWLQKVICRKGLLTSALFLPTASQVTLRVRLALTAMLGLKSWDLDATCTFISALLPKGQKLYLKPIEGYPLQKGKVLKLLKSIYGLIQAPLAFYLLCSKIYTKVGYTQLKSDECVFVRQEHNVKKGS